MRLLPRDADLFSVASTLSLAVANYKPIPQLPATNTSAVPSALANTGSQDTAYRGSIFKVQTPEQANAYSATHDIADWGEPSTLYVPVQSNNTDAARKLAAARKVGPGKCPYAQEYTPNGGWKNLPPPTFPAFDPVKSTIMRYRQQQGVNLGTWFVQEGWMETNFMACALGSKQAEYNIVQGFGTSSDGLKSARAYMEQHWDTWITEADFAKMAKMGINTVRLPIGYWSVGPTFCENSPFAAYKSVYMFSWRYVARAINWAAKYDIGVIVDLHGAYGSQNGQAHSGFDDGKIEFFQQKNLDLTTNLLVWLAKEISDVTNVVGIQLVNEPVNRDAYWPWLTKTMDAMRKASPYAANVPLYFHDAFVLSKGAKFASERTDFVVSDHHAYYVYTPSDQSTSAQGHISQLNGRINDQFESASATARRNLIVGEWSCALSESSLKNSKNRERDQKNFCQAQQDIWQSATAGFTFWSWKLENCDSNPGWCFEGSVGRYLPSTFNAWGLPIAPFSSDSAKSKLLTAINAIKPPKEQARVGMVVKPQSQTRGIGSLAARAARLLAPTTDVATRGFSDGFLSARIFAASGALSRIGFSQQYRADSWNAHLTAKTFKKSEQDVYYQQFATGVQAAEAAIAYIATNSNSTSKA